MRNKHRNLLSVTLVLLCIALLAGTAVLLLRTLPKKQPGTVETIQTGAVFDQTDNTAAPDREQAYDGELPNLSDTLEPDEAEMFMADLGLTETGLDRLIKTSYDLLGYISFLTAGEDDVHACTITRGTKAPKAAGKVHSDIERGFIRAEIVAFDDLKACGSMAAAKEKGLLRLEGKDYVMQDGDITNFRFNI